MAKAKHSRQGEDEDGNQVLEVDLDSNDKTDASVTLSIEVDKK